MLFRRVVWVALAASILALCSASQAQFESRASLSVGGLPNSLAIGDFNGDGTLDVAEVNTASPGSVEILLGNGDGTFKPGAAYVVPFAFYLVAASLRNNGILDLVLGGASTDDIYVMLGNGDGTFRSPTAYSTTAESKMVALGDFTGGGNLDVVTLEGTSAQGTICNCVEILPGNGDGTFGAPITTPVPYNVTGFALAAGDFNDDGKLDLAVSGGYFSSYQVDILLGDGDGTFNAAGYYPVSATPQSIALGYFTGDKTKLDLAVANYLGSSVSVLLGNGDGTFQQSVYYPTESPTWVVAQDLDGDGNVDLAVSNAGLGLVVPPGASVLKGNGDGTFQPAVFYRAGSRTEVNYVAVADFNGDHRPDLALVDVVGAEVVTLLNTGDASFSPATPLNFGEEAVGATSKARTVTLTNTGGRPLEIKSMKASPEFGVRSTCGASVASGSNCTISVRFSPTKQGTKHGTVEIIDSASTKPQVIELLGTGT
jgi:hypothetical protein